MLREHNPMPSNIVVLNTKNRITSSSAHLQLQQQHYTHGSTHAVNVVMFNENSYFRGFAECEETAAPCGPYSYALRRL